MWADNRHIGNITIHVTLTTANMYAETICNTRCGAALRYTKTFILLIDTENRSFIQMKSRTSQITQPNTPTFILSFLLAQSQVVWAAIQNHLPSICSFACLSLFSILNSMMQFAMHSVFVLLLDFCCGCFCCLFHVVDVWFWLLSYFLLRLLWKLSFLLRF